MANFGWFFNHYSQSEDHRLRLDACEQCALMLHPLPGAVLRPRPRVLQGRPISVNSCKHVQTSETPPSHRAGRGRSDRSSLRNAEMIPNQRSSHWLSTAARKGLPASARLSAFKIAYEFVGLRSVSWGTDFLALGGLAPTNDTIFRRRLLFG